MPSRPSVRAKLVFCTPKDVDSARPLFPPSPELVTQILEFAEYRASDPPRLYPLQQWKCATTPITTYPGTTPDIKCIRDWVPVYVSRHEDGSETDFQTRRMRCGLQRGGIPRFCREIIPALREASLESSGLLQTSTFRMVVNGTSAPKT